MESYNTAAYFDLLNKCQKAYGSRLEPVCRQWNLTRCEVDVMLFLYNNPEFDRAADIVSRRGIAKSHVSMSVTTLESRGLLERVCSATDRRTVHLKLTQEGTRIAGDARSVQQAFFRQLYHGVSQDEMDLMARITHRIFENIETIG